MDRRDLLKGASALGFLGVSGFPVPGGWNEAALAAPSLVVTRSPSSRFRQTLSLNKGWRFFDGDIPLSKVAGEPNYDAARADGAPGPAGRKYDDGQWPLLNLPHDFVISRPFRKDAIMSEGYRRRGIGWYRRQIRLDPADRGKHLELQFDGIGTHATIWLNGNIVCRSWSGFSSAYVDITPYVTYGDELNTLVVRADAQTMEGWWYEGGGIYRNAWIVKRSATHIVTDGLFAHPVKGEEGWTIPVEVTANTSALDDQAVTVVAELWDGEKLVARDQSGITIPTLRDAVARMTLRHASPRLWDIEDPYLYRVVARVEQNGQILDEVTSHCGFRTQRFDADKGFFLNDRPVKLQGVCVHQDHAGVGVAMPDGLLDYRLRRLKELGCNAIRATHHAQDRVFLEACDRMGFLVMNENRNFNTSPEYMAQLRWLVRRDRNHPSIILWSICNEEPPQGSETGYETARRLREAVRELDMTRPVTGAMNDGHFSPTNISQALDVAGFNYKQDRYDRFHAENPHLPMISTEDTSAFMTRGAYKSDPEKHIATSYDEEAANWGATHRKAWKTIAERDFIAGGFVWTGFDYHGEPTPYDWPSNSTLFGIMDLCGFEKSAFYIHQALWVKDRPILHLFPHWNWAGQEGQPIKVVACSNLDEVELRLNGKAIGRQKVDKYEMNHWMVPYAPGRLDLIGYKDGKPAGRTHVETTGPAVALRLTPDRQRMKGDGWDAQPVKVEAVDAKGRFVPLAQDMVTFAIEGGEIIGVGNGNPTSLEPDKSDKRSLFNGLAQVIVRSLENSRSPLTLSARADGLKPALVKVIVEAAKPPPYQG